MMSRMGELLRSIDESRMPCFVAAGVIKTAEQIHQYADIPELAAVVLGSFSAEENVLSSHAGKRNFYYDPKTHTAWNALSLQNPGLKAASDYLPESIKYAQAAGQVVIVSVTPLAHDRPEIVLPELAQQAMELGADGVELNLSCPNEEGGLLCRNVAEGLTVVDRTRERVGSEAYLLAKMSGLGEMTVQEYKRSLAADAITAINSPRHVSPVNPITGESYIEVNDGYAGRSGLPLNSPSRANLRAWLRNPTGATDFPVHNSKYDVWSVGGVSNGYEIFDRVHNIGAYLVGAAQEFYRSDDPAALARDLSREFHESRYLAEALADS